MNYNSDMLEATSLYLQKETYDLQNVSVKGVAYIPQAKTTCGFYAPSYKNTMKKISTLYKKDPNDLGRVINEINPENEWVINGEGIPTRKFDGTATAIIDGELYKRYDVKKGRQVPDGAIPCQEADAITGHHPHWLKCDRSKNEDKYFFEGFDALENKEDGTYELCGKKIQGNPENIEGHRLIKHGCEVLQVPSLDFEDLKAFLSDAYNDIEGIVFHHKTDGRMCKIRKCDFGIRRAVL